MEQYKNINVNVFRDTGLGGAFTRSLVFPFSVCFRLVFGFWLESSFGSIVGSCFNCQEHFVSNFGDGRDMTRLYLRHDSA